MAPPSFEGSRPACAFAARGACAGAVAGAAAAICDHLLARTGASQFLPDGTGRLLAFLLAGYAGLGALAGEVLAIVAGALARFTDLGPLLGAAFRGTTSSSTDDPPILGSRLAAVGAAALLLVGAHGLAVRELSLAALTRFHGHLLIAALVGAASAGLAIVAAVAAFPLARLISAALPVGPRVRSTAPTPPAWLAAGWTLGLLAGAAAVLRLVDAIQLRARMSTPVRALNVAIWAPPIFVAALALGHLAARRLARALGAAASRRAWRRPAVTVAIAGGLLLAAAAAAVALSWPTAKLLPWKAFVAGAAGIAGFAVAALGGSGAGFDGRSRLLRAGAPLMLPLALLAIALELGGAERVRKAAMTHTGLAGPLLSSLRVVSDFDRDGYAGLFGPDCDDLDPEIHPGAFDWPDDGIDQNCNGRDATAQPSPRAPFPPLPQSVPVKPNVLLITIDAVRADHVGAYGYPRPTTPNLDALARQAALFKNGWAHSPSTRYSVPAILAGRYESTIAWGSPAVHWPPPVLPENRLLAEMFQQHGYRTAALLPAHYFEPAWGLLQGFDDYDVSLAHLHDNVNHDPARATGSSSRELADLGIAWIERHKAEPFFLWLHFYDPHYLYERHAGVPDFGDSDLDRYDGELAFTDLHIGRLLDGLRAAGLWDRTITIATADHGEGLGEHGVSQHGYHIYAQQNKVPFIVRVPGLAPRAIDDPVGHVDLFPSLLNLIGAPDEPQLLGRSFVDLLAGTAATSREERVVYGEVEYEGPVVRKSVATRDWHLIDNVTPDHTVELYHLSEDPQEAHDLAGTGLAEERRLRGLVGAWMDASALPADFAARVAGRLSDAPLPFQTPIGATLAIPEGDAITLEGIDVTTPEVRPGGEAEVTLVWRARRRIPAGWRIFTHLTPSSGPFINADHQPVESFVPLQRLKPGQHVRDRIRTQIPPFFAAGPLTVEVGLFKGGERARVTGPDGKAGRADHVLAATLQVAR